jgi:hypothetical protein
MSRTPDGHDRGGPGVAEVDLLLIAQSTICLKPAKTARRSSRS